MEVAVGVSIMVIGATGRREAREWREGVESCTLDEIEEDARAPELVMAERQERCIGDSSPPQDVTQTLLNGILNGICGTGHVLGVLPALAMPSWIVAGAYLGSFGIGTFLAMALFTGLVGELSSQMGTALDQPSAPANLAMASSTVALALGTFWTSRALVALGLPAMIFGLPGRLAGA